MMIKRVIIYLLIFSFSKTIAQVDTRNTWYYKKAENQSKIISSKTFQMLDVPIILISVGLAYKSFDRQFNSLQKSYTPNFQQHYDDYTQYLPAITMVGLKIAGVDSRSSWCEMITADAFSAVIMAGVVGGLKNSIKVTRPDGAGDNSFPSGHSATAFMTATMFHKEYGDLSQWYSIGAYGLATTTQITRMLNTKHWASDVLVGTAIGILSVELGYLLSDLIFKNETRCPSKRSNLIFDRDYKPSFVGIYSGINLNTSTYNTLDRRKMEINTGASFGAEGAWFMNPYVGIGGLFTAATSEINIDGAQTPHMLNVLKTVGGLYLSYPLHPVLRLGTKALIGADHVYKHRSLPSNLDINDRTLSLQSGVSILYLANENLGMKLFTDYNYSPTLVGNKSSNEFVFGMSFNLAL